MEQQAATKLPARKWVYSLYFIISFTFVLLSKAIGDLARDGNVVWDGAYLLETGLLGLVLGAGLAACLGRLFYMGAKAPVKEHKTLTVSGGKLFWLSTAIMIIGWLPYFLAYYPCIGAYDIHNQMWQIGNDFYYDHHPLMHTLTLRFFLRLGEGVFNSMNFGLALYSMVQMLLLAMSLSYGVCVLRRFNVRKGYIIAVLVLCAIYPFNGYMSISMTKDIYFTAFVNVFIFALLTLFLERPVKKFQIEYVLIVGSVIGSILYRNNGKYAILVPMVLLVILVFFHKKERKFHGGLLLLVTIGYLIAGLILPGLSKALDADQGDRREMLSVPIQQFARTMLYHGGVGILPEDDNTMSAQEKSVTNYFILHEGYKEYLPQLSDPVKSHTNTAFILAEPKKFFKVYIDMFFRYPGEYINAVLATNAGYLSPFDETHGNVYDYATRPNLKYVQTYWQKDELAEYPVYQDSKWPALYNVMQKWTDENGYLNCPVLKYLFVPGTFFWAYVLLTAYALLKRKFDLLLPLSYVAGFYLTLFLGPTVQLRYLYPMMVMLPFMVLLGGVKKNKS